MRGRLACWVLGPLLWTGCAAGPGPRPRRHTSANAHLVGCLDIDVSAQRDPVLAFDVVNTCPHPVAVEFRNLVVRAWAADGTEYRPAPSDPRDELFQAQIDGHQVERVVLAFPVWEATPHFCVDVARLDVDEPAPYPVESCFRSDVGDNFLGAVHVGAMFELHTRSYDGFFVRRRNAAAK